MSDKREVTCTYCGKPMLTAAKKRTSCKSCHKDFDVRKAAKAVAPKPQPTVKPMEKSSALLQPVQSPTKPVTIGVSHTPETRGTSLSSAAPSTESGEEESEEDEGGMISPDGLYMLVTAPNQILQLVYSDIKELELDAEEEKYLKDWAAMTWQYCIEHGYHIPDYLQLVAIVMAPFGFYAKRTRLILAAQALKKPKPEEETPPPIGTHENPQNEDKAKTAQVDMDEMKRKLGGMPA